MGAGPVGLTVGNILRAALVDRVVRQRAYGYSEACLRRVWDCQEFSQWLSDVYHGTASGDPDHVGTTLARLRRLFTSPAAAGAFAKQYLGTATRY